MSKMTPKEMCEALESGTTMDMIAKQIGKTKSAVSGAIYRYRKAHGLKTIRKKAEPEPHYKTQEMKAAPITYASRKTPMDKANMLAYESSILPNTCRNIDGDMRAGTATFCDKKCQPGSSYCPEHHARFYAKAPKPRGAV
jgi:hypothetical protein